MQVRSLLVTLLVVMMALSAEAQSVLDVWNYSTPSVMGTARGQGIGGAMSAVGADFSAAFTNPAGFGLYRSSEVTFSAQFRNSENTAEFFDGESTLARNNFGIGQAGFVKHSPLYEAGERRIVGWKSWTLGIGYTQVNSFNRNTQVTGFNPYNSLADFYAWQANGAGTAANGIRGSIATYDAFVYDDDSLGYFPNVVGFTDQTIQLEERGRMGQWTIAFAGNFSDWFYAGASIGIADISNNSTFYYLEQDITGAYTDSLRNDSLFQVGSFNNWDLYEELSISGVGVNFSVGVIIQPIDYLRFSAAFHSPTWASIGVSYFTDAYLQDDGGLFYPNYENSEFGSYRYNLQTPARVTLGAMGLLGKYGFLSADVDFINYSTAELQAATNYEADFSGTNQDIQEGSASAINLRLGGELKLGNLYLRGGYALYGKIRSADGEISNDPATYNYDSGTGTASVSTRQINSEREYITGGIGYKANRLSIDIAYIQSTQTYQYGLYSLPDDYPDLGYGVAPVVFNKDVTQRILVTLGYKLRD